MDTQLVSHLAISQRRAALTFIDLQEYLRVGVRKQCSIRQN